MIFSTELFPHSQSFYEKGFHFIQFFSAVIEVGKLGHGVSHLQTLMTSKLLQLVNVQLGVGDYFVAHSPLQVCFLSGRRRVGGWHKTIVGTENRNAIGTDFETFAIFQLPLLVALFLFYVPELIAKFPDNGLRWPGLSFGYGEGIAKKTFGFCIFALGEIDIGDSSQNFGDFDTAFSMHGCLQLEKLLQHLQ